MTLAWYGLKKVNFYNEKFSERPDSLGDREPRDVNFGKTTKFQGVGLNKADGLSALLQIHSIGSKLPTDEFTGDVFRLKVLCIKPNRNFY